MPNDIPRPKRITRNHSRSRSTSSDGSTEQRISLGARISQNIEMAKKGYEQLVHAIIRPPRAKYKMEQLGPPEFIFLQQRFRRDDVELLSSNVAKNEPSEGEKTNAEGGASPTCSFLKMQASIWTRVVDDDDDGNDRVSICNQQILPSDRPTIKRVASSSSSSFSVVDECTSRTDVTTVFCVVSSVEGSKEQPQTLQYPSFQLSLICCRFTCSVSASFWNRCCSTDMPDGIVVSPSVCPSVSKLLVLLLLSVVLVSPVLLLLLPSVVAEFELSPTTKSKSSKNSMPLLSSSSMPSLFP
mmetsp:Transcript_18419/g.38712  ORF Transcript_18419/g.38712 Transcript_18419/m.38712 type:complete len:298 (+) Transcript_18419:390-1283(+)